MKRLIVALTVTFLLASVGVSSIFAAEKLTSVRVSEAPKLDGQVDSVWASVEELAVPVAGGANTSSATVKLKSVHIADSIYFLVQWADPTQSLRRSPWQKQADGTWKKLSGGPSGDATDFYEDKFAFLWNINDSIAGFNEVGCMATCHLGEGKPFGNKYTNKEGEKGDIWHWKSVRTGPVEQVDDQYLDSTRYDKDKSPEAGRKSDPKTGGGYANNDNNDRTGPAFTSPTQPGAYWILDSEKQPFNDTYNAGDEIAGIIVAPFVGDRGDISGKGVYANGMWTLELGRKWDTGSDFDVQFTDTKKPYYFGVAVFDNAQVRHSFSTAPIALILEPEVEELSSYTVALSAGLNIISLPLQPEAPMTAKSLAEKTSATVVITYDPAKGRFVGYTPIATDEGFALEGGKGYIVNVKEAQKVVFKGTAWSDTKTPPAAPPQSDSTGWAFVVAGTLFDKNAAPVDAMGYTAIAVNHRTGAIAIDDVGSGGDGIFHTVWADLSRNSVVKVGDEIVVTIKDAHGTIVAKPKPYRISAEDIKLATLRLNITLGDIIPETTALAQNYPNPFNPETWIPYQLAKAADNVTVKIFDMKGQIVRTFYLGYKDAGIYMNKDRAVYWNGKNDVGESVASGVYFYHLQAGSFVQTQRMVLLK